MEFELEYDSVVNKNKSLFYFQHYSSDTTEFTNWIQYNTISVEDYKTLCKELQDVYMEHENNIIVEKFKYIQNVFKGNSMSVNKKFRLLYELYVDHEFFINNSSDNNVGKIRKLYQDKLDNIKMLINI